MRTQKFRLSLILKKTGEKSVGSEIEVTGNHRAITDQLRRALGKFKAKAPVGTFVIEVSEAGQEVRVDGIEVDQAIVDQFASLARGGYDDMVRYEVAIERFMVSEGIQEARRVASEIMVRPELFAGIDVTEVQLMERCRDCGDLHEKGGIGDKLRSFGKFFGIPVDQIFGQPKEKPVRVVFRLDSNSDLARNPLFNKADLQVRLVTETKEWLVDAVQAKDVDLAMAKRHGEEGIAHNKATLEALRLQVEAANASCTQHLAAVALEAEGLKLFVGTLRASGIEVFTPACDDAFPTATESTTATDIGADDKDTEVRAAPAGDSEGRVKSPAIAPIQAAPAASGATEGDGIGDNANNGDNPVATA